MNDESVYISQETLTFQVLAGVWGEHPPACVQSHHAGSSGGATDQAHWGHFVSRLLQHLAVKMHWENLGLRAHTHQMKAHRGMSTDTDIWKEKKHAYHWL